MAYLDGEIPAQERVAFESHLAACDRCAGELAELRTLSSEVRTLIALTQTRVPLLAARARLEDARMASEPPLTLTPWRRRTIPPFMKAAAVVLLFAGAASAAIPGSPLRRLAEDAVDLASRLIGLPAAPEAPPTPVVQPPVQEPMPEPNEVFLRPVDGRVRISIRGAGVGSRITVKPTNDASAHIRALGEPGSLEFTRGEGFLEVVNPTSDVIIELPRGLEQARVEVNGRTYYVEEGETRRLLGPTVETTPTEVIFEARQ